MIYHLGLGSNLHDPEKQLEKAVELITADPDIEFLRSSRVIRTAPYGIVDQPDFWNQVLEISSHLEPQSLLQRLLALESEMGRIRAKHWGPRIIDIDILLAESEVMNFPAEDRPHGLPALIVPHPDLHNRLFMLQPLMELIPLAVHPVLQKTISELYYALIELGGPI